MTEAEYEKLSPDEKQAVVLNALCVWEPDELWKFIMPDYDFWKPSLVDCGPGDFSGLESFFKK